MEGTNTQIQPFINLEGWSTLPEWYFEPTHIPRIQSILDPIG